MSQALLRVPTARSVCYFVRWMDGIDTFLCDGTSYVKEHEWKERTTDADRTATTHLKWSSCYHCNRQNSNIRRFKLLLSSSTSFCMWLSLLHFCLLFGSPRRFPSSWHQQAGKRLAATGNEANCEGVKAFVCEFVCFLVQEVTVYLK
jgi:hypothetical protein